MKHRYLSIPLSLAAALFVSGCFEYEERLVLNHDGSGKMEVHYFTGKDVNIDSDFGKLPKEKEDIRSEVERNYTSNKVKLTHFEVKDRDENRHVYFTVSFQDVLDLNELKQFGDSRVEVDRRNDGVAYRRTLSVDGDWDDDRDDSFLGKLVKAIVAEALLEKIKFRFEVEMPDSISKSNAQWVRNERVAVWRYRLWDLVHERRVEMRAETHHD